MKKIKRNNSNYVSYKFILIASLFACTILPKGYEAKLTTGTWQSIEPIDTPSGIQNIIYTKTLSPDGVYEIEEDNPLDLEITRNKFLFKTGYYAPKYAIILYEFDNPQAVVGLPIFYYFSNDKLVTSTNSNMALARIWSRI
ncbi:MAG: hypothetical protein ACRC0X_08445 [Brevinema sp.]